MTLSKLLPIGLISLGCWLNGYEQSQISTQLNRAIAASVKQSQSGTQTAKPGKQIGPAIDCDNDEQQDDIRMDYDGDDIPDDCVLNQIEPIANEINYAKEWEEIQKQPCEKAEKIKDNVNYIICSVKGSGKIVSLSEAQVELGDGLGFWLKDDRVRAIVFFHTGDVFFFNNGRLEAQLKLSEAGQVQTEFSVQQRNSLEEISREGMRDILEIFGR